MNQQAVLDAVTPVVAALGLEVDRLETAAAGKRTVLRVFLDGDGPDGVGPSLDELADATRAISAVLDESPAVGTAPYLLEVSSRGVGRPLTEPKHFRRNTGRLLALKLADGTKTTVRLVAVSDDTITVLTEDGERVLPYAEITKAVVQVELNRLPEDAGADDPGEE